MLKVAFGFAALLTAAGCAGNGTSLEGRAGAAQVSGGGGTMPTGSGGTASSSGGTTSSSAGVAGGGSVAGAGGQSESAGGAGTTATPGSCGGPTGITCPKGEFCDLASNCGAVPNATGVCAATGRVANCDDAEDPEGPSCGCEGRTYANTCQRQELGMLRASSGICPGGGFASYPTGYGAWQAAGPDADTGPAVVVSAAGSARTWDAVAAFPAETPPPNPTATQTLTREDTDDLFLRLAAAPTSTLPHEAALASECRATFYFRLCDGCAVRTLSYERGEQVLPELEYIWSWFDRLLGPTAATNPRNFCK